MIVAIPLSADAAIPCPDNATPNLQVGDLACWTSKSSSESYTCTWDCTGPYYACDNGVQGTSKDVGKNCKPYLNSCTDTCGNYWGCSNRTDGGHGTVKTYTRSTTAYTCHYYTVSAWTTCINGIRTATAVTRHTTSGKNCENLNESTVQTCGVCTPGTNIDVTKMPTTTGVCAFGTPTTPVLAANTWTWQCKGSDDSIADDDAACSVPNNVDGACNSAATMIYAWNATGFNGDLCTSGTPTINRNTSFPEMGREVTWGCSGIFGGNSTAPDACRASRPCPQASCGSAHSSNEAATVPTGNFCADPAALSGSVAFESDGWWHWNCAFSSGSCVDQDACSVPSCLRSVPFELQPYVYFDSDGTPNNAMITGITCPNVCCTINGQDLDSDDPQKNSICNGESGKVEVAPGATYTAQCWFDDGDGDNDGETFVTFDDLTVQTMCTARSCNNQGTCQATPQAANSSDACTSTCNSDADCSRGRMIETRP